MESRTKKPWELNRWGGVNMVVDFLGPSEEQCSMRCIRNRPAAACLPLESAPSQVFPPASSGAWKPVERCLQELQARSQAGSQAGSEAAAPSLQAAAAAGVHLEGQRWDQQPGWEACLRTAAPLASPAAGQMVGKGMLPSHSTFLSESRFCYRAFGPATVRCRSQAGPHAGAWLAAIPADPATTLAPDIMHLALRRRMRLLLPLTRA